MAPAKKKKKKPTAAKRRKAPGAPDPHFLAHLSDAILEEIKNSEASGSGDASEISEK